VTASKYRRPAPAILAGALTIACLISAGTSLPASPSMAGSSEQPNPQTSSARAQDDCWNAPDAPSALTVAVSKATVIVAWQPPPAGCPVTSYLIEAGAKPGRSDFPSVATAGTDRTVTLREVDDGLYYVRVRAINPAGASPPSNEVVVTVGNSPCGGLPTAPDGLFATVTGRRVAIQWAPPGRSPTS